MFLRLTVVALAAFAAGIAQAEDTRAAWHPVVDSAARMQALFAKPPAEYSTSPFYVWNADMKEAEIDKFLASYSRQGIHSIFIHPRPGLITPYLSERWFQLVRYTVDQGAKLGMEVWLYDENSYPSGFAGGHVPAVMPESYNQGQGLVPVKLTELNAADVAKYKVILKQEGDGFRDITATAAGETGKAGSYYGYTLAFYPKKSWHGGWTYVDLIKPGVTEKFIEVTMKGYEKNAEGRPGASRAGHLHR